MHFLITHAPLTVERQYLVHEINVTQGALSLIFVSGNLKMHRNTSFDIGNG